MSENTKTKPKILCIEDEAGMRELLQLILETDGYVVLSAQGGEEGLAKMRSEHPDLVLLDLMLPDVDGAEVLLRKKQDPAIRDIAVIAVTALSSPFDQLMWKRRTEIKNYIAKPFKRAQLISAIEEVLAGQTNGPQICSGPSAGSS